MIDTFFSTKGRIGRLRYFGYTILLEIVVILAIYGCIFVIKEQGSFLLHQNLVIGICFFFCIPFCISYWCLTAQRFHDMGRKLKRYYLGIMLLLSNILWFLCCIIPGTKGANKYGEEPV